MRITVALFDECACIADLPGDGRVDGKDLGLLLNQWGGPVHWRSGDLNHDSIFNGFDLDDLFAAWGPCP